jgi:lysophospholipase
VNAHVLSQTTGFANTSIAPVIAFLNATYPQPGVELDTAQIPNPFLGVANTTFIASNQEILNLIDGGENGEEVPLQPLLVKARGVDVIFAIDAVSRT